MVQLLSITAKKHIKVMKVFIHLPFWKTDLHFEIHKTLTSVLIYYRYVMYVQLTKQMMLSVCN